MKTGIFFAALLSLFGASAFASEWNNFVRGSDEAEYFFDAESVVKTSNSVTLWVKAIQREKPESDGSWAIALRWRLGCPQRTLQLLSSSTYDADGKFIKSNSNIARETVTTPDSIGAGILKIACMADFPKNIPATNAFYFKVTDNDVFAATKRFIEADKSRVDNAPK